jgi:acetoin utilization deacetylase AcuC-like enzyme
VSDKPIGIVHDPLFQEHDPGSFHPESPARLVAIDRALNEWAGREVLQPILLREATREELARVHRDSHLERVAATEGKRASLDPDTQTSPASYRAALAAAGSLIDLCDAALEGRVAHGAALVRPPGHHATPTRAMGFCLFNNVAVAAAHLVEARGLERVLIVDWDVHHGNGTEEIFYEDPRVLYFSTHQSPFYPGTGAVGSVGRGEGEGYTLNVPLYAGQGDSTFVRIFEDLLLPVANAFRPRFILVSAGFDAHRADPLGGMRLTAAGYGALTAVLRDIADEHCPGCIVLALEGGYDPPAVGRSVVACLEVLAGRSDGAEVRQAASQAQAPEVLRQAQATAGRYWKVF